MSNVVLVLGRSGMGKSTSIRNLDPATTVIINVLSKKLPFKGADSMYSKQKKNLFAIDSWREIQSYLDNIDKKAPHVRNVVIDDATYIMRKEFFDRAREGGYDRFTEIAMHMKGIISKCESMRDNLNVFMLWHTEPVVSDNVVVGYKPSTVGRMVDSIYNPCEVASIVLFAETRYDDKGTPEYGFWTKLSRTGKAELPAKTPDGMFEGEFIPNDLGYVAQAMADYYK